MRRKRLLIIALTLALLAALTGGALAWASLGGLAGHTRARAVRTATPHPTSTTWVDPHIALVAHYAPVHLEIPSINLNVAIIPVGATSAGNMDAPRCNQNTDPICNEVYWYSGGYLPGQIGNAAIAGHINRPDLSPAPFWNLWRVRVGDPITVVTQSGETLAFTVTSVTWISAYVSGADNPILDNVFGPAATRNLNLMTCIGDWDGHTFDHRLLVQAQLSGPAPFPGA